MNFSKSGNPFNYGYPKSPKYGPGSFGSKIPFPPPQYTSPFAHPTYSTSSKPFGGPPTTKLG